MNNKKDFDDILASIEEKCPQCGTELDRKEQNEKLTTYYYKCGHKFGSVVSNETRSRTNTIEVYVKKDLDELYEELGKIHEYTPGKLMVATASIIDFTKLGKKRWERIQKDVYQKLCIEYDFCKKYNQVKELDLVAQGSLVMSLIGSLSGTLIPIWMPIALISSIIVKFGITKFCKCS